MYKDNVKISCQHLWKIFGPHPDTAWKLALKGGSRNDIMEQTGHVLAVKDVSFDVHDSEIFVVMGLSGSGKSTIIRCINRLINPTKGDIFIDDDNVTKMNPVKLRKLRRHKLSMVFQNFGLFPHRSVIENVAFGLEIRGESKSVRANKAMEALEQVELAGWENARLSSLSGGMQQRVGLARALAVNSEIILMDEPFSALDPLIRRQLQDEFLKLRDRIKRTIIFITHDLAEALKLGDRIGIMKDGEIVQIGTPQEIVSQPANSYVREFVKDVPRTKLISAENIMQDPKSVVWSNFEVDVAVREMVAKQTSISFVTDSQHRLIGVVTMKQAVDTPKDSIMTLGKIVQSEVPTISPSGTLEEALSKLAETEIPLAVLDEHRHLLGVISRETIIQAIKPFN